MIKIKRTIALAVTVTIIMAVCSLTALGASFLLSAGIPRTENVYGTCCQVYGLLVTAAVGSDAVRGDTYAEAYHYTYTPGNYAFYGYSTIKGTMYTV